MFRTTRFPWALLFGCLVSSSMHAMDTSEQQLIERGVQSVIRDVARSIKIKDDSTKMGWRYKTIQFSADSERVLTVCRVGVKIYDVNARYDRESEGSCSMCKKYSCIYDLKVGDWIDFYAACWLSGDRQIVTSSEKDRITIRDLETDDIINRYNTTYKYKSLSVSPDGKLLALAPEGRSIVLLNLETNQPTKISQRSSCNIPCVRFSPDGKRIAFIEDKTVSVYNLISGDIEYKHLENENNHEIFSLCFDSDGSKLATGGWYCPICVYDMATGELQAELNKEKNSFATDGGKYVHSLSFFPDGKHLASIAHEGDDELVCVLNCEDGTCRSDFGVGQVLDVSPDGTRVVVGGESGLWFYESSADGTRKEHVDVLEQPHIQFLKEQDERLEKFFDGELTPEQKNILLLLLASEDKEARPVVERMLSVEDITSGKDPEALQGMHAGYSAFHPIIKESLQPKIKRLLPQINIDI